MHTLTSQECTAFKRFRMRSAHDLRGLRGAGTRRKRGGARKNLRGLKFTVSCHKFNKGALFGRARVLETLRVWALRLRVSDFEFRRVRVSGFGFRVPGFELRPARPCACAAPRQGSARFHTCCAGSGARAGHRGPPESPRPRSDAPALRCISQLPHKSVNLSFIFVVAKDKLTDVWGCCLMHLNAGASERARGDPGGPR